MGTNYYLRNKPTDVEIGRLIGYIKEYRPEKIKEEVERLYSNPSEYNYENKGIIHLGKRSAGWKFLWNPNLYLKFKDNDVELVKFYDLTKKGIYDYLKEQESKGSFICTEYYTDDPDDEFNEGEILSVDEFFSMATNWDGYTSDEYPDKSKYTNVSEKWNKEFGKFGYAAIDDNHFDFERDGLRFSTNTEFS